MSAAATALAPTSTATTTTGAAIELTESGGRALKLQTDAPHLVSLGGGRLSTAVTLHPIPQGRISLGSGPGVDITVQGTGVEPLHCQIENNGGVVTLYPVSENLSIDGAKVIEPTRLSQGVMLTIGRSNYMRFNHPAEAQLMKSVLPNTRISMAPIKFNALEVTNDATTTALGDGESIKYAVAKKPPATPRRNSRESSDPDEPPSSIQMKVSKFEYLAAQNFKQSISPKVFSSNLVTVNTPARDVLGRAPPDLQDFAKNLPQPAAINYADYAGSRSDKQHKNKTPDRQFFGRKSPQYVNVTVNNDATSKSINNRVAIYENGCVPKQLNTSVADGKPLNNNKNLNNVEHQQQYLQLKPSNVNRVAAPQSPSTTANFAPSPSFNRDQPPYFRSLTPGPAHRTATNLDKRSGSLGEIHANIATSVGRRSGPESLEEVGQAEALRNQARANRVKEQEMEKAEQARLEEILNMCAEYEKQAQWEKSNKPVPNRIITNGSLPRDKRQCPPSPFSSLTGTPSPNSAKESISFRFDLDKTHSSDDSSVFFEGPGTCRSRGYYENVDIAATTPSGSPGCVNSPYENVHVIQRQQSSTGAMPQQPYPQSPRTRIKTVVIPIVGSKEVQQQNISAVVDSSSFKESNYDHESLRKPTPTKLIPVSFECVKDEKQESERKKLFELKKRRDDTRLKIASSKRQIGDIRMQEEERYREYDLELCLINAEYKSKFLLAEKLKKREPKLVEKARQIEHEMQSTQSSQSEHQESCRMKLEAAEADVAHLEKCLQDSTKGSAEYQDLFEDFLKAQEVLDNERKTFEDLEFHHLETQANWLATREELQREIIDVRKRIQVACESMDELSQQKERVKEQNANESRAIEDRVLRETRRLEKFKTELKEIECEIGGISQRESDPDVSSDSDGGSEKRNNKSTQFYDIMSYSMIESRDITAEMNNMTQSFNEKMLLEKDVLEDCSPRSEPIRYPSQDDIDLICKVTSSSPMTIEDGQTPLSKKTIESLKEIELNRQIHLAQQGSQVIEEERRRVLELKQRAQDEVRLEWAKRQRDRASLESMGSNDMSITGSDDVDQKQNTGESDSQVRTDELLRSDLRDVDDTSRPLSDTSDVSAVETGGTLNKRRPPRPTTLDKTRPLTRYLPIRDSELDLRQHVESAGHQVVLCPHVIINSTSCRGFLHKRGSKLQGWSRRWFVFDRTKRSLVYYADKSEKKVRGGAYFKVIEEVYMDHSNSVKSPNPQLTFIIKTHQRYYYLMAPSPEAMRIWMDVVFTGAEGYQEFEHGN